MPALGFVPRVEGRTTRANRASTGSARGWSRWYQPGISDQPGTCAFLADGGLATGALGAGAVSAAAGFAAGVPAPSPQHTSALAWQVCSSKTMKLRNKSHFTSFLPTVYLAMPWPFVQSAMYLSSSFLASLVGPSLP